MTPAEYLAMKLAANEGSLIIATAEEILSTLAGGGFRVVGPPMSCSEAASAGANARWRDKSAEQRRRGTQAGRDAAWKRWLDKAAGDPEMAARLRRESLRAAGRKSVEVRRRNREARLREAEEGGAA